LVGKGRRADGVVVWTLGGDDVNARQRRAARLGGSTMGAACGASVIENALQKSQRKSTKEIWPRYDE
jgi:hypothetical protein